MAYTKQMNYNHTVDTIPYLSYFSTAEKTVIMDEILLILFLGNKASHSGM